LVLSSTFLEQDFGVPEPSKGTPQTCEITVTRQVIAIDRDKGGSCLLNGGDDISGVFFKLSGSKRAKAWFLRKWGA